MGGGKAQTVGYWYEMGLHMGVCKGPIDALLAIDAGERSAWQGEVTSSGSIFINALNLFGGEKREGGLRGVLDCMFGEPDQQPNAYLGSVQGGGHNPAYRGIFSTVFRKGRVGAMNPYLKPWAYRVRRTKKGWEQGECWYPEKAEIDVGEGRQPPAPPPEFEPGSPPYYPPAPPAPRILCANAAHVIYEILTDTEDGMGYPTGELDDASFRDAADVFHAEGLGLWVKWMQSDKIEDTLRNVLDHVNAMLVQDPRTLKFRLIPMRDDYVLSELLHFGPKGGAYDVPCVLEEFDRSTIEEAVNEVTVTWDNSADGKEGSITVQNPAAINAAGGVVNQAKAYACCPTAEIAARLAQRDVDVLSAMLARVRIVADRRAHDVVAGQVIRLSWPTLGIVNMPVRALRITTGNIDGGEITIEGTEDVFGFSLTSYVKPQPPGFVEPSGEPQPSPVVEAFEVPFRDLVQVIGLDAAKGLDPMAGYLGMAAAKPGGVPMNFNLYARTGTEDFTDAGQGDFTPTAVLATAITRDGTEVELSAQNDMGRAEVGAVAFLGAHPGAEAVRIDAIDGAVLTIARGCLDTVPQAWPPGTRLWVYDNDAAASQTEYVAGEEVDARAVTNATRGILALELAPEDSVTMNQRQARPYPPGLVRLNGELEPAAVDGALAVTWAHRDRFLQQDQVWDQEAVSIGPDPTTRYGLRFLDGATVLVQRSDVDGVAADVVLAFTGLVRMELFAINDAGPSWQRHVRDFAYTAPPGTTESVITAPTWQPTETIIDGGEVTP